MQATGAFLGLTHELFAINTHGHATFWARERLHHAVCSPKTFPRSPASKLHGAESFLEQGIYGCVGYGSLIIIKDHQDEPMALP